TRLCGSCTACCTWVGVVSLAKPAGCRCAHEGAGCCTIYPDRPDECRAYRCLWLDGWGDDADRPDRSGVLLHPVATKYDGGSLRGVGAIELGPGAVPPPGPDQDLPQGWTVTVQRYSLPTVPMEA